ncbi:MAG: pitrilysin family protein [Caldimonas sp.]
MRLPLALVVIPAAIASGLCGNAAFAAPPANVEHVETFRGVAQYRLKSNGMTILLAPDRNSPVFTFMVVYHVGSRNEAPGNTGSAHLLEHMIFNKSTANFGKANGHPTFQDVLYEAGADAGSSNMTTWYDRMNGYSTLPAGKLELAMRIEADRMQRALILDSERQSEMSVVRNEYEISENNPTRALQKALVATAIQAHPYHWSTIGYRSDIEGVTTAKLREHYQAFFHPDNSEAILAGDFDTDAALALFDREFGAFPKATRPIPQIVTVEPAQEGERRVVVKRPGSTALVALAYPRPGASHPDFFALEVLASVLGDGVNARLYQALVERGLATSVNADNYALRDPYPLLVGATCAPGKSNAEVEAALKEALAALADKGISAVELQRAQQQIEVEVARSRDGPYNVVRALGEAVASADWKWFLTYVERIKAVSADDVKRVAATCLVPDHATVGWFVPAASARSAGTPAAARPAPAATAPAPAPIKAVANEAAATKAAAIPVVARPPLPAATTAAVPFATRTVRKVLPNGLVVDVVENHTVQTVAVRGLVMAGNAHATAAQSALPALTGKMLSRGTTTRSKEEIGALLAGVGADRRYLTTPTELGVEANGMARDLPLVLGVLADELRRPAFAAAELAKAKAELENDVLRADDDTSARAQERLAQLAFAPDHPYRPPGRAAKLQSLGALGVAELRDFHRARYVGKGTILAIVGDVDAAATIARVVALFGDMPAGEAASFDGVARATAAERATREAVTMRGKANMNIVIGGASGLRRLDPDYEAALVSNAVFGQSALASRVGRRVRDSEGLTYSIGSRYTQSDVLDGLWQVNVNVAPQNVAKALRSTLDEMAKYAREGATDAEVAVQKNFFAGNYQVNLGSNAGVAAALVGAEKFGLGPRYLDEFPARIRAVTTAEANAAMRKHFAPEKLHVVVAGDLDSVPD